MKLSVVTHTLHTSYSGGRNWEDQGMKSDRQKERPPTSENEQGMVVHVCDPSYAGSISRRILVQSQPQAKMHKSLSEK
jgi:hypothetical protein